jgi:hypothetical protein
MLRRLGISRDAPPTAEAWSAFLDAVRDALNEAEQDRYTLERSLSISSDEMLSLYDEVKLYSETALATERDKLAKTVASMQAIMAATEEGILFVDLERSIGLHNSPSPSGATPPGASSTRQLGCMTSAGFGLMDSTT